MLDWLRKSLKENHLAQMALCCLLPVVAIAAMSAIGLGGAPAYAIALVLCVGSHLALARWSSKEGNGKTCH